jgi:hypothetical protein
MPEFQFDICQSVLTEYDADGFLGLAWDAYGEKRAGVAPAEVHWHGGIGHRPRDPDTDNEGSSKRGANVWQAWEGNQAHIILGSDPRAVPKLPRAKKGGSFFYADTGKGQLPYIVMDGDDGSFTLYVPYAFSGLTPTKAMAISIDVPNQALQIVHGSGSVVSMLADGSVSLVASDKGASITVSAGGHIVINGNTVINGGATIGSPVGALPAAIAGPAQAYLTALEALLLTVSAATQPPTTAAVTAFIAANAATKTAISATKTNIA